MSEVDKCLEFERALAKQASAPLLSPALQQHALTCEGCLDRMIDEDFRRGDATVPFAFKTRVLARARDARRCDSRIPLSIIAAACACAIWSAILMLNGVWPTEIILNVPEVTPATLAFMTFLVIQLTALILSLGKAIRL